ncbi:sodium- and chloride-dependent glycine transporter 2-like [Haliotis asinina]|uniref:sodium- and chloride-dependent glycine transporter 2-like n=1 Tax=Haliotis asinina TaxID=109174 RepID=UPI003531C6C6
MAFILCFDRYNTLRVSSGFDNFGSVQLHLVICIFGSWLIAFFCLLKGVRSVGKVVYVTAVLPYILLTTLLIRTCMMPGAGEGIVYFLRPDFSRLASVQVWLEALLQGFYSMSVTYGGLITMSTYTKFHNNSLRDVVFLTVLGEASSIFCGLVVFSTLGFVAHHAQIPISDIVSSGSGLGFIIYPEAISHLPVSQLWAVLFFIMLITLGMASLFGPMETVLAGIVDAYPKYLQPRRMYVTAGVCLFCFLMSVPYATNGGIYLLQLLDWYNSSFSILLIGCLECIVINWIYGWKRFGRDIQMMIGKQYPIVLKLLSTYVTPFILFASLIFSLFCYDHPSYGEYIYPEHAKVIGILMAVVMSLPIPIALLHQLIKRKGTFCERLRHASRPADDWRPSRRENRDVFLDKTDPHLDSKDIHIDNGQSKSSAV